MRQKIALVTYRKQSHLQDGERLLLEPLKGAGFEVVEVPWDKPVDWCQYDCVIIRATWDYHTRIQEFRAWLDELERGGVKVWNPIPVIRWNLDKHYLLDLEQKGIPIIPSSFYEQEREIESEIVVVKPIYGASGYRVEKKPKSKAKLTPQVVIQPFMDEVVTEGEYSFIFFNKIFSHAVLKQPHGGRVEQVDPPEWLVKSSQQVVDTITEPLLYARVDGINHNGKLLLMELELIEPYLFFETDPASPTRFASALDAKL